MCDYGIPLSAEQDLNDLFPTTTHLFEGGLFSVPADSHKVLQHLYGDYMQLPDLDYLEPHVQRIEFYD